MSARARLPAPTSSAAGAPVLRRRCACGGKGADCGECRAEGTARAAESARALGASAYALGHSVVLGPGSPSRGSEGHTGLPAHELAHVAQSGPPSSAEPAVGAADDPAEGEADRAAEQVVSGQAAQPSSFIAQNWRAYVYNVEQLGVF